MVEEPGIRRILVGVDEATAADHAVRAGVMLADAFGADLELLHAAHLNIPRWFGHIAEPPGRLAERLLQAARISRKGHLKELLDAPWSENLDNLLTVVPGKPARAILDWAESNADLIVLGGHRPRGALHFGATARAVLGGSKCPVWVQAEPLVKVERILAAVDMSPNCQATLRMARALGSKLGASVLVFHSFVPPYFSYDDPPLDLGAGPTYGFEEFKTAERQHFEKIITEFDWRGVKVETTFSDGNPAQGILNLEGAVDLTVMGTHGRTGLARAILGSQAYGVIVEAHKPVLVVPNPEREYAGAGVR